MKENFYDFRYIHTYYMYFFEDNSTDIKNY